jgi:hypothetical protein
VLGSFAAAILVKPYSIQGPDAPDGKWRGHIKAVFATEHRVSPERSRLYSPS